MIDILVPVLGRPQNAAPLVDSIKRVTETQHTIVFLCSPEDKHQIEACQETKARVLVVPWRAGRSDYPRKMNYGLGKTKAKFVLMGADDLDFERGWDTAVLGAAQSSGAGVIGTNDCANKHVMQGYFSTHPLVRRSYVMERGGSLDGPGSLVSEAYDHNYCDRELCHLAQSRGAWSFVPESRIRHRHPLWRTAPDDSTYARGRKTAHADHLKFYERASEWGYTGILPQEQHYIDKFKRSARRRSRPRMPR